MLKLKKSVLSTMFDTVVKRKCKQIFSKLERPLILFSFCLCGFAGYAEFLFGYSYLTQFGYNRLLVNIYDARFPIYLQP